jgi:hypothetical protein
MKTLTAEEVLTKYSDGTYKQFPGYENILMAMKEYAELRSDAALSIYRKPF